MSRFFMSMLATPAARDEATKPTLATVRPWFGSGVVLPVRLVAFLWLLYCIAMLVIDRGFASMRAPGANFPLVYYSLHGVLALSAVGLTFWRAGTAWLGRALLPLVIIWVTLLPIFINLALVPYTAFDVNTSVEGMVLRLLPLQFIGLVLVAWRYPWRYVALYSLGIGVLNFISMTIAASLVPTRFPIPTFVSITGLSLLASGSFVFLLMSRLRTYQASLEQANAQLQHYNSTLESLAITRERNRVARELHDTLAHALSGLMVQLETAKAYWDVDPVAAKAMLEETLAEARTGLQETRRALKAIRATPLDDLGLRLALQTMAAAAAERTHLQLTFSATPTLPLLAPDVEQSLYRIAQEAVTNVVHHAQAQTLTVELSYTQHQVSLLVRDDGVGFHVAHADQPGHYGLVGMHERALLAGGHLSVDSQPGQGTTVRFDLPLETR